MKKTVVGLFVLFALSMLLVTGCGWMSGSKTEIPNFEEWGTIDAQYMIAVSHLDEENEMRQTLTARRFDDPTTPQVDGTLFEFEEGVPFNNYREEGNTESSYQSGTVKKAFVWEANESEAGEKETHYFIQWLDADTWEEISLFAWENGWGDLVVGF